MDNNKNNQPNKKRPGGFFANYGVYILMVLIVIGVFFLYRQISKPKYTAYAYNEYVNIIDDTTDGLDVSTANAKVIGGENEGLYRISGKIKDTVNDKTIYYRLVVTTDQLEELSSNHNLDYTIKTISSNNIMTWVMYLLPYVLIIGALILFSRSGGNSKAFDFGKSRARMARGKTVTFNDVAGCDEEKQELVEVVDFLKNPKKYVEIGARIPKGVLLFGPPGTGKTLLAKAVAGEANVPFFSISGSDFVEMFVGVGASRVRDMFKVAKENHPCIIFIDEIDAVGRQRGAGMGGGHDEREQTLNQLLVEMDGFSTNMGIIVMAATNRPDVLDPALLRPGRFDRQITISSPDVRGREAILKVHARNKNLDPSVKLDELAARIPGFSGADIENLLNEAAILAARDNRKIITTADLDEATDRVMMGPAKRSRKYTENERKLVAYHEAGHAVVGLKLENASIVQKITIIPRGQAGGYNLMMPKEETYFRTKKQLTETIVGFLGGRVAEEIMFGDVSTGAHNDFENATKLARSMVTEYGMSSLGPIQYEQQSGSVFLGRDYLKDKNFSDQVALEIDKEVRKIIEECYETAKKVIKDNMDLLSSIAEYLLKIETLNKSDIDEIYETGKLKWCDEREAKKALEASQPKEENTTPVEEESTSIVCPVCGFKNEEGSVFCARCGKSLEKLVQKTEEPKEETSTPAEEEKAEDNNEDTDETR